MFWILALLLAAAVVALVVRPLVRRGGAAPLSARALNIAVYRDHLRELDADLKAGTLAQADYDRAREELEKRLLEDVSDEEGAAQPHGARGLALAAAAGVPVLALAVYLAVGNPAALQPAAEPTIGPAEIEALVGRLAERLEKTPEDVQGWTMLGRSYQVLGRFEEAARAFRHAAERSPKDPRLLADLADALAMAQGQSLKGEPERLVLRALELDPDNLKALALAGTAAFEQGNYAQAAALWERMLPHIPPESEDARMVRTNVEQARVLAKQGSAGTEQTAAAGVTGMVKLSPEIAGKAAPDDTVFVFARPAQGAGMPLAVLRRKVSDLPLAFKLDDSMAMTPAGKLSAHSQVVVVARVSRSGSAAPQPGDLEGLSAPVPNTARNVEVLIDEELR
ncbi:MAG TPA: c-type cytochrome biogenesis protein CcmI [Burkholderiales bacterium]|nr:c-type cytochrome biogenesis protein CcmI [Burkholderiales bacterium]